MFSKYYILLSAPRKPNPPAPLPYEGMGVSKPLSYKERGTLRENAPRSWREVWSIVIDALLHPLRQKSKVLVVRASCPLVIYKLNTQQL